MLPPALREAIWHIQFSQDIDKPVWSLSSSGNCLISSTYKEICNHQYALNSSLCSRFWSKWIPTKLYVHIWKVFNNCIPTDSRIKSLGIALPSKCHCCNNPAEEDINHLFVHSEWASFLWSTFHRNGCQTWGNSSSSLIHNTINDLKINSLFGQFQLAILAYGLWEVWLARNAILYEGKTVSSLSLFHKVLFQAKQALHSAQIWQDNLYN